MVEAGDDEGLGEGREAGKGGEVTVTRRKHNWGEDRGLRRGRKGDRGGGGIGDGWEEDGGGA